MMKNLFGAAAVVIGLLLFSSPAAATFYQVQVGDTLMANGYCDTEAAAMDLYQQIAQRAPNIPLAPPAECHPDSEQVTVGEVLAQSPSVRTSRSAVLLVKAVGVEDRWYIGFTKNVQQASIESFVPAVQVIEADANKWMSGETVVLVAYCNSTDEHLVRDMSAAIVNGGWKGYVKWINGPHPCFDSRLPDHYRLGVRAVQGILLEKLWTVKTDDVVLEIWRFMDGAQQFGFTWLASKSVPENEV